MGISKVDYAGSTLIDLTEDTVTEESLLKGYTAHNKAGELITGTHECYLEKTPIKMMIKSNPTKVSYTAGEVVDLDGLSVSVEYISGMLDNLTVTEEDVTSEVISSPQSGSVIYEDTDKIELEWTDSETGKTFTDYIDVHVERVLSLISVSAPYKTEYTKGDILDLSGANVTAHYTSGNEEDVTENTVFLPEDGTVLQNIGVVTITATYTENNVTKTDTIDINVEAVGIVTWANGTDEQIAAMLEAHYNGDINIHDYWNVGDERQVSLSAMPANYVSEYHVAQTVTMVLMNKGGKELVEPINGNTECAFIVGQKGCLLETGNMNSSNTTSGGWDACARRRWCNETYYNAIPPAFKLMLKEIKNYTANGGGSSISICSEDYIALPSEKEILGTTAWADSAAEANNRQFSYYVTKANRIKKVNGEIRFWWLRSPKRSTYTEFCHEHYGDTSARDASDGRLSIAPFCAV